jgi:hypothetical protein
MKLENLKYWKYQAKVFSAYARDEYNEGRALLATLGSNGQTFTEDIEILAKALRNYGDNVLAELIEKKEWMFPCGKAIIKLDKEIKNKTNEDI